MHFVKLSLLRYNCYGFFHIRIWRAFIIIDSRFGEQELITLYFGYCARCENRPLYCIVNWIHTIPLYSIIRQYFDWHEAKSKVLNDNIYYLTATAYFCIRCHCCQKHYKKTARKIVSTFLILRNGCFGIQFTPFLLRIPIIVGFTQFYSRSYFKLIIPKVVSKQKVISHNIFHNQKPIKC